MFLWWVTFVTHFLYLDLVTTIWPAYMPLEVTTSQIVGKQRVASKKAVAKFFVLVYYTKKYASRPLKGLLAAIFALVRASPGIRPCG